MTAVYVTPSLERETHICVVRVHVGSEKEKTSTDRSYNLSLYCNVVRIVRRIVATCDVQERVLVTGSTFDLRKFRALGVISDPHGKLSRIMFSVSVEFLQKRDLGRVRV